MNRLEKDYGINWEQLIRTHLQQEEDGEQSWLLESSIEWNQLDIIDRTKPIEWNQVDIIDRNHEIDWIGCRQMELIGSN